VVTAAFAFALQALLTATDAPAATAINILLVPPIAGAVIFAGLQPYPLAGRLRLAAMVAVARFLLGLSIG
jgi:hypothetical protein